MTESPNLPSNASSDIATSQSRAPVIVGVDGSESSRQALLWGAFLSRSLNVKLVAITVWEPLGQYSWGTVGWTSFPSDWNPAADAETVHERAIEAAFGDKRPDSMTKSIREGTPARVLIEASGHASTIVVGSRGHGGFAGLLLGSVSAACTEHGKCPVFVVHGQTPPPPLP